MFSAKNTLYPSFGIEVVTTQPRNCQLRPIEHPASRSLLSACPKNSSQTYQAVKKTQNTGPEPRYYEQTYGLKHKELHPFQTFYYTAKTNQPPPTKTQKKEVWIS